MMQAAISLSLVLVWLGGFLIGRTTRGRCPAVKAKAAHDRKAVGA